jgi:hypothetical protein
LVDWHYTLHFTPTIVVGLTALLWTVAPRIGPVPRLLYIAVVLLYLVSNIAVGLGRTTVANGPLPVTAWGPLRRGDYGEMERLVSYLRTIAPQREPIVVAAASLVINSELLRLAEHRLHGVQGSRLNVLPNPDVDSRDFYPLENLIQAKYVLVVEPFQYHMSPEEQGVIKVMHDLFVGEHEFAKDFVALEPRFALEDGATLRIYERDGPTSLQVALRTLDLLREYVPDLPGEQGEWSAVQIGPDSVYTPQHASSGSGGRFSTGLRAGREGHATAPVTLAYLPPLPDQAEARGRVSIDGERCGNWRLTWLAADASGRTIELAELDAHPGGPAPFQVPIVLNGAEYLLLSVTGPTSTGSGTCRLDVQLDPLGQD